MAWSLPVLRAHVARLPVRRGDQPLFRSPLTEYSHVAWEFMKHAVSLGYCEPARTKTERSYRGQVATVTPHSLRHQFGIYCARAGLSSSEIKQLMGHGTTATTERCMAFRDNQVFALNGRLLDRVITGQRDRDRQRVAGA